VTAGAALHRQNDGKKATRIERVYRFQFGVDARTMTKFARVQSLAAIRAGGNVDLSALFEVLCDTYLERYDAATRADRRAEREDRRATADSTDRCSDVKRVRRAGAGVPPAVRDRVIHRDGGRCTFVDRNGQRCTETIALQVDHVKPAAIGGTDRESNLRAMCPAHNRLLAERTFGRGTVERAIEASRPRSRKPE
jgi:5-methylcytosine-specific restriction endonuclease McrA